MNEIYETYHPPGFSTLNSYIFSDHPLEFIKFLKETFEAIEEGRTMRGDELANCILKIGNTALMVSQSSADFRGMTTSFYLYVSDVDLLHTRSLENGCSEVLPPGDQDYGDRQSGIQDPYGNYWWISKRQEQKPYH